MIPKTAQEMTSLMLMTLITRAYGDITTKARRRRLTEHDIATIERRVLAFQQETDAFAGEFEGFQSEVAVAAAFKQLQEFFGAVRVGRIKQIQQK